MRVRGARERRRGRAVPTPRRGLERVRRRLAGSPPATWVTGAALVLAVLLSLPAFGIPLDIDEHLLIGQADGSSPWMGSALDVYCFSSGEPAEVRERVARGSLPWFTCPEWKYALWRPAASLLFAAERLFFGLDRTGYQLHTLLWYLLSIAAAGVLLRRCLPGALGAGALLLFAVHGFHAEPLGWLGARHPMVAAVPGFLAVAAHLRWRLGGWRPGAWLAPAGFALGLALSETGLQCMAFLVAFELLAGPGGWRGRARALLPAVLLVAGYLLLYRALDRGVHGFYGYTDPFAEPLQFLGSGVVQLDLLLGRVMTAGGPSRWTKFLLLPAAWLLHHVLASLPERERASCRWLALGGFLALLPVLAGVPEDRVLFVPSLAACALVAATARLLLLQLRGRRPRRLVLGAACAAVVAVHVVPAPARLPLRLIALGGAARAQRAALGEPALVDGRTVLVLVAPRWLVGQLGGYALERAGAARPRSWHLLSMTWADHRLERTGDDRFELSVEGGWCLDVRQFRDVQSHPLRAGEVVRQGPLTVSVLEVLEGVPRRIEVVLDRSLDDPSLAFLSLRGEALAPVALPPCGGSIPIADPRRALERAGRDPQRGPGSSKAGKRRDSTQLVSRPSTEPLCSSAAISPSMQAPPSPCEPGATTWSELGKCRAASSPKRGGVTGSKVPERINAGASERTGSP